MAYGTGGAARGAIKGFQDSQDRLERRRRAQLKEDEYNDNAPVREGNRQALLRGQEEDLEAADIIQQNRMLTEELAQLKSQVSIADQTNNLNNSPGDIAQKNALRDINNPAAVDQANLAAGKSAHDLNQQPVVNEIATVGNQIDLDQKNEDWSQQSQEQAIERNKTDYDQKKSEHSLENQDGENYLATLHTTYQTKNAEDLIEHQEKNNNYRQQVHESNAAQTEREWMAGTRKEQDAVMTKAWDETYAESVQTKSLIPMFEYHRDYVPDGLNFEMPVDNGDGTWTVTDPSGKKIQTTFDEMFYGDGDKDMGFLMFRPNTMSKVLDGAYGKHKAGDTAQMKNIQFLEQSLMDSTPGLDRKTARQMAIEAESYKKGTNPKEIRQKLAQKSMSLAVSSGKSIFGGLTKEETEKLAKQYFGIMMEIAGQQQGQERQPQPQQQQQGGAIVRENPPQVEEKVGGVAAGKPTASKVEVDDFINGAFN